MFHIAWCDKYDLSLLCLLYFINSSISREHVPDLLLLKINICRLLYNHQNVFLKIFLNLRSK